MASAQALAQIQALVDSILNCQQEVPGGGAASLSCTPSNEQFKTVMTLIGACILDNSGGGVTPVTPGIETVVDTNSPALLPATVKSFTISVISGTVTVTDGAGTGVLPTGSSFSWGEGTIENLDTSVLTITGTAAGANYIVHWEE